MATHTIESRRDRVTLAEDAGLGRLSAISVLAGMLAGDCAFAILLGGAAAIAAAAGHDPGSFTAHTWHSAGLAVGVGVAVLVFVSYLFGGYVAGRMARRAGAAHGVTVFVSSLVVAAGTGALVRFQADTSTLTAALRDLGLPTAWAEWRTAATVAGIGAVAAMLVGAMVGATLGERWHGKLVRRAADPEIGPAADARAAAAVREEEAVRLHRAALTRADRSSEVTTTHEPVLRGADREDQGTRA